MPAATVHTALYHDLILAAVPRPCAHALDIGCGLGAFSRRLATLADRVEAIDRDPLVIEQARLAAQGESRVHFACADFMSYTSGMSACYDFVCALASLHHLGEEQALARAALLLRPGGVFAAIGLYKSRGVLDLLWSLTALPVALLLRVARPRVAETAPLHDPVLTLPQIRMLVAAHLPAAKVRRHLLWRYTVLYRSSSSSW